MLPLSKYLKYGLLTDDLIRDNEITKEALRRLPKDVFQERQYRLTRAISLSGNKDVLPQSEWTKPDEVITRLIFFTNLNINRIKNVYFILRLGC